MRSPYCFWLRLMSSDWQTPDECCPPYSGVLRAALEDGPTLTQTAKAAKLVVQVRLSQVTWGQLTCFQATSKKLGGQSDGCIVAIYNGHLQPTCLGIAAPDPAAGLLDGLGLVSGRGRVLANSQAFSLAVGRLAASCFGFRAVGTAAACSRHMPD